MYWPWCNEESKTPGQAMAKADLSLRRRAKKAPQNQNQNQNASQRAAVFLSRRSVIQGTRFISCYLSILVATDAVGHTVRVPGNKDLGPLIFNNLVVPPNWRCCCAVPHCILQRGMPTWSCVRCHAPVCFAGTFS